MYNDENGNFKGEALISKFSNGDQNSLLTSPQSTIVRSPFAWQST